MNTDQRGFRRRLALLSASVCVCLWFQPSSSLGQTPALEKRWLSGIFYAEGANAADLNGDGKPDIVAGPYIYWGPEFTMRSEFMPPVASDPLHYSKNFFVFPRDFDGDGLTDIMIVGFPGEETFWYKNPGTAAKPGTHWKRFLVVPVTGNESPTLANLVGDETPELVFNTDRLGYAVPDPSDPTKPWVFHPVSPKGPYQRFTHGMGVGDVNGDGRPDLLEKGGWWEQPASLEGDPEWKHHPFEFSQAGGAQMFVYDVDGDGDNDVITSLHAHGFGLAWYENVREGGEITFRRHLILSPNGQEKIAGTQFAQLHALSLVDFDGDGIKDVVTGKRYWAHGPTGDADATGPAVLYWFKLSRKDGGVTFTPYPLDGDSGVGTQLSTPDLNGDGKPDVVVCNKRGTILFLQK